MINDLERLMRPRNGVRHLFFGGKGGVGKTTLATATAVWLADSGYETTIVSTDPTISLSAIIAQQIGGREPTPIRQVRRLCGLNINPADARGVFQTRLSELTGQISGSFGDEMIATPCADEMAAFDQFVGFLDDPPSEVVVFDTAPTGKTLRELAMPFDWAGFLQRQIEQGKELAQLLNTDEEALAGLEHDRQRYETALTALRDPATSVFTLVLLPERLPIEETASAIAGLARLGIPVQALATNQVIPTEAIQGNRFLSARSRLQARYLGEIDGRFADLLRVRLPLLDSDVSDLAVLRQLAAMLYGPVLSPAAA